MKTTKNKLNFNKVTVNELTKETLFKIKGGTATSSFCPSSVIVIMTNFSKDTMCKSDAN